MFNVTSENSTLWFVAGAPGSAWSMISHRLKKTSKSFDYSDETPERQYNLPEEHKERSYDIENDKWKGKTHIGSYFGPYHEFGEHFDDLTYYDNNVEDFYKECLIPFSEPMAEDKIIRSHWFAYNLDWLWENCKGHKMLLVWREPVATKNWWYQMGGWNIHFPVYKWYDNDERMWEKIQEESNAIWEFGQRKGVQWLDYDNDSEWIVEILGRKRHRPNAANPIMEDIIKIGYLEIS